MSDRSAAASSPASAATVSRFACTACGKSYKWKPELAAHKVKCTCGHVMKAPATPPPPPPPKREDDDLIPLADDPSTDPAAAAPAPARRPPVVDHDHTVHGHQILVGSSMGEPAITIPPDPDPPAPPAPPPAPPAPHKSGRQTSVRVQSSMIPHDWSKPPPVSSKWPLVVVGVALVGLIAAIVLMVVL